MARIGVGVCNAVGLGYTVPQYRRRLTKQEREGRSEGGDDARHEAQSPVEQLSAKLNSARRNLREEVDELGTVRHDLRSGGKSSGGKSKGGACGTTSDLLGDWSSLRSGYPCGRRIDTLGFCDLMYNHDGSCWVDLTKNKDDERPKPRYMT
jgi:hypothetical protein